jgi:hypothetical protein
LNSTLNDMMPTKPRCAKRQSNPTKASGQKTVLLHVETIRLPCSRGMMIAHWLAFPAQQAKRYCDNGVIAEQAEQDAAHADKGHEETRRKNGRHRGTNIDKD